MNPNTSIEDRVRRTLHTVADSYAGAPAAARRPQRRTRRWVVAGIGAVALPLAVAAAVINIGPEYVDEIPPPDPIVSGEVHGSRYWLVETERHHKGCAHPVTGVELIAEADNIVGQEWNTTGAEFGSPKTDGCGVDTADALAHPEKTDVGGTFVGDEMVVMGTVHPDVTAVRVTVDGKPTPVELHQVDGAGYYVFEAGPSGTPWSLDLLRGDRVLPGSHVQKTVPAME